MTGNSAILVMGLTVLAGGAPAPSGSKPEVRAVLRNASGAEVGKIEVKQETYRVRIKVSVHSLPQGKHGLHIHANGTCGTPTDSAGPFAGAGPHFDPLRTNFHAGPNGIGHAGDLGNVTVGPDGTGKLELTDRRIDLGSDSTSVIGKAVVLHANPDNLGNSPANGGSGARLACGVLEKR